MKNTYNLKYPIIIIPGLFGSWGEGIFMDNNRLGFGPAKEIYSPLLDFLIKNGYRPYKNLYIAFYNWRIDNSISAKKYLIPVINKAKAISKTNKVILICHSMGGLVARSYIQGSDYQNDVDTLIMLGTPNSGSSTSYLFWEGGEVPYENLNSNILFKIFWNSYLWHLKKNYNSGELYSLQEYFPSIKQFLPTKLFYGPYLYRQNKYGRKRYINIENMKEQNSFLESLNIRIESLKERVENIHQIIGYGYLTNDSIQIKYGDRNKWMDGKPVKINKTTSGDGTVTVNSSKISGVNKYYIKKDHSDLVKYSNDIIKDILGLRYSRKAIEDRNVYISLLLEDVKSLKLQIDKDMIKNNEVYKYNYITPIPLENEGYWLIIKRKNIKHLELEIDPKEAKEASLLFSSNKDMIGFDNFKEEKLSSKTKFQLIQ
ncbi:hypothetical protein GOQ27_04935 [Clostridium sp. D2Q-11]|uniref:Lecithin:cholesterol acyltransferase n=1 Tax=Anaeromonas frigoriresistens TaxID=2683708 RepID=A0A942UR86_9FIRM|nr:hypothetical protein [Anaeromonas frigoriresistens]MBS4537794.1 hypothetical protein [Anaeromonas frigoriresistens]